MFLYGLFVCLSKNLQITISSGGSNKLLCKTVKISVNSLVRGYNYFLISCQVLYFQSVTCSHWSNKNGLTEYDQKNISKLLTMNCRQIELRKAKGVTEKVTSLWPLHLFV